MTEKVGQNANDTVISEILEMNPELEGIGNYEYGWADSDEAGQVAKRGLDENVVRDISAKKNEPQWMLDMRLKALKFFERKPMPTWGADLSEIDFDNIKYFVRSTEGQAASWEELPEDIRTTYERLGIPEAERNSLVAGVAAQYESEVVYHQIREDLEKQGVIFVDTDTGLREYPELFKEYFGSIIPIGDNKFSALNTAVWSGGSFVYVPPGVHVEIPLQAYFRINTENMGTVLMMLRLAVQVPLYFANNVEALGATRLIMGLPLYALGVWLAWRVSAPEEALVSADAEADETAEVDGSESR